MLLLLFLVASIGGRPINLGGRRARRDTFNKPVGEIVPTRYARAQHRVATREDVADSLTAMSAVPPPSARELWRLAGRPRFTAEERKYLAKA